MTPPQSLHPTTPPTPPTTLTSTSTPSLPPSQTPLSHPTKYPPALLDALASVVDCVSLDMLNVNTTPTHPIEFYNIYASPLFTICAFVIKKGESMPIHDHPEMTVFSKLVYGDLKVKTFDFVQHDSDCIHPETVKHQLKECLLNNQSKPDSKSESQSASDSACTCTCTKHQQSQQSLSQQNQSQQNQPRLSKIVLDTVIHANTPESLLRIHENHGPNLHTFTALSDSAVILDIIGPPYEDSERPCTYFHESGAQGVGEFLKSVLGEDGDVGGQGKLVVGVQPGKKQKGKRKRKEKERVNGLSKQNVGSGDLTSDSEPESSDSSETLPTNNTNNNTNNNNNNSLPRPRRSPSTSATSLNLTSLSLHPTTTNYSPPNPTSSTSLKSLLFAPSPDTQLCWLHPDPHITYDAVERPYTGQRIKSVELELALRSGVLDRLAEGDVVRLAEGVRRRYQKA
ncbi:hypothetical protein HDV05_006729 [Chytridiales sp. JEL 0842]|nr:hypothetical protein HDV05_006729 [Chytridiales sp. JEL 0842]